MSNTKMSQIVGSVFGLIYIEANADGLPPLAAALRVLGAASFVGLLIALWRRPAPGSPPASGGDSAPVFGGRYWAVVTGEVVVGLAGIIVIGNVLDAPRSMIAWITLVVGIHFLALATVMRYTSFRALGTALAVCGVSGLVLAALGLPQATPVVAGILPGLVLLSFVGYSSLRQV